MLKNGMKGLLLTLCLFSSFTVFSQKELEIQCQIENTDLDLVIKRSPDTLRNYALLFSEDDLKSYVLLKEESIELENELAFRFKFENEYLTIDLENQNGEFSLPLTGLETGEHKLINCKSTILID